MLAISDELHFREQWLIYDLHLAETWLSKVNLYLILHLFTVEFLFRLLLISLTKLTIWFSSPLCLMFSILHKSSLHFTIYSICAKQCNILSFLPTNKLHGLQKVPRKLWTFLANKQFILNLSMKFQRNHCEEMKMLVGARDHCHPGERETGN